MFVLLFNLWSASSFVKQLHVDCQITYWLRCCIFLYNVIFLGEVEPSPLLLTSTIGPLNQSWMIDGDACGAICGMNKWQG
jgi:hypothetical protein